MLGSVSTHNRVRDATTQQDHGDHRLLRVLLYGTDGSPSSELSRHTGGVVGSVRHLRQGMTSVRLDREAPPALVLKDLGALVHRVTGLEPHGIDGAHAATREVP